jgi:hypothetical protein
MLLHFTVRQEMIIAIYWPSKCNLFANCYNGNHRSHASKKGTCIGCFIIKALIDTNFLETYPQIQLVLVITVMDDSHLGIRISFSQPAHLSYLTLN